MPTVIRNTLIRLFALIEQVSRGSLRFLSNLFKILGRLVGLSTPSYYMQENAQNTEPEQSLPSAQPAQPVTAQRRRGENNVDAFRKMAQQIKQDQQT